MKVQLPWYGKAAGSSAKTIYQSYWGNTYTRSFPFLFHYPDTAKQQETQAAFFAVQRAWWTIYPQLATYIPKSQRHNRNIYNTLSKGMYQSMMTYKAKDTNNIKQHFGLDNRQQVKLNLLVKLMIYEDHKYFIYADLVSIDAKRHFIPRFAHYLLYNIVQQEFYYKNEVYKDKDLTTSFEIENEWDKSDIVIAYLALSDENFFTDFYLCTV